MAPRPKLNAAVETRCELVKVKPPDVARQWVDGTVLSSELTSGEVFIEGGDGDEEPSNQPKLRDIALFQLLTYQYGPVVKESCVIL